MKKTIVGFGLSALALSASATLTVEEAADGSFVVRRNGQVVLTDIRAVAAGMDSAERSFAKADGADVWNRWNTNTHVRCEVVRRADGAVEMTVAGHSAKPGEKSSRGITFRLPGSAVDGKRWKARINDRLHGTTGEGTFGKAFKPFTARYLATDGIVLNLDALGPGIYGGGSRGVTGLWNVKPDGAGGALFNGVGW